METEDILMCPGPNEIADRVIRAMLHPAACPVYEEFQEFYEQTLDMLAQVFQTAHAGHSDPRLRAQWPRKRHHQCGRA